MSVEHLVVLSTCPDRDSAERIADALIDGRHAACVNILPGLTSVYRWQNEVCRDPEVLLIIKTTDAAYPGLQSKMRQLHPNELPELLAIPVRTGLAGYLDWMVQETGGS